MSHSNWGDEPQSIGKTGPLGGGEQVKTIQRNLHLCAGLYSIIERVTHSVARCRVQMGAHQCVMEDGECVWGGGG